ncbi:MAG TPA: SpoIIE family protein phosphatase [Polyangiaceae bacterium]|nr:SpoIIE family protein phosphatase [Polyangiaceae bacterium]
MRSIRPNPRIALIVNYLDRAYQIRFRTAFETAAQARGIELFIAVGRELDHGIGHERALNRLYDWLSPDSVDAVAVLAGVISNYTGKEGVLRLCRQLLPLPHCSIGLRLPGVPSIVLDNRAAMRLATRHLLIEHGCRRIAYVSGPDYNEEANDRLLGYRDALEEAGIAFDPRLVAYGHFTRETGHAALTELYTRDSTFDAVVAANDDMAVGVLDALFERGRRVPEDVKVVGFDDVPVARLARRSLTTMAQPLDEMAAMALDGLLDTLRGVSAPPLTSVSVGRMVTRESCGCGYVLATNSTRAPAPEESAAAYLRGYADEIAGQLAQTAGVHAWEPLLPQLAWGLASELEGSRGAFLRCVEHVADSLASPYASADSVGRALVELRRRCQAAGYHGHTHYELERACLEAQAKASAIAHREQGRRALRVMDDAATLRTASQDLAMVLSSPALAESFSVALRQLGISTGFLAVSADEDASELRPLIALEGGATIDLDSTAYPARQLFPRGFPVTAPSSLMLQPLTVEDQVMGLVAFASHTEAFVCEALRSQLSAAIKLGALHARVVSETAMRERLANERLLGEVATARRIQSALCPRDLDVTGFDLAAQLIAADQVGGDYYDVMPAPDGCWIGIGDVTGHGLLAGLIMLMIQSSAGTAVLTDPDQPPSDVVCRINTLIQSNVRGRLDASEHATLSILRAHADGRMVMAGAHEDVIVHRKASGTCELIPTDGVWVGIAENVREATRDTHFQLDPGDTVVLYTDGLIEARDAQNREFDIQQVCSLVTSVASQGPRAIVDALVAKARAWTPVQQDDMTVVALRRR